MRSASSAAATDPGVFDAVKMNGSDVSCSSSMASVGPSTAPPQLPERLGERDGHQVDVAEHALILERAPAAGAEHPEAVRLVVEQERVRCGPAQGDELGERRGVAAHGVDAVDDHALRLVGGEAGEHAGEVLDVVVTEPAHPRPGEPHTRQQRVVGLLVDHGDAVPVEEPGDGAGVRDVAGGEHEAGRPLVEVGEFRLEGVVQRQGPVQEPGAGDPGAELAGRGDRGLDDPRVVREAEVVVGTEVDDLAALDGESGT